MKKLSWANLPGIDLSVARPTYDRSQLTPGIVHIGCGNFHRAHQAWYLEQLFRNGLAMDWAIVGAGVRSNDALMREKLMEQDFLTTLIELSPNGKRAEVIGSMIDFVPVEPDNSSLIDIMADPRIRIVSLTVTEGGYFTDAATAGVDHDHPDIRHDAEHPAQPRTAFGAMVAALRLRRERGYGPITGLSCDNIQGNGNTLKRAVLSLARLADDDLVDWIETNCSFPNSMVDCIVPNTGPKELALAHSFGIEDAAPVAHEPFRMWVIEDDFCAGRPPWEKAGAIFSNRVDLYEKAKIRILNGGGQILGPVAELLGYEFVAEAIADDTIRRFFRKCEETEILPLVDDVPGYTAAEYLNLVVLRFSNRAMADTTRRFAQDGSSRQQGFLLPSVRDSLAAGGSVDGLALVCAFWCRYCLGVRENKQAIEANDPLWSILNERAVAAVRDPMQWLLMRHVYGNLANDHLFASAFTRWLRMIYDQGVLRTLREYVHAK